MYRQPDVVRKVKSQITAPVLSSSYVWPMPGQSEGRRQALQLSLPVLQERRKHRSVIETSALPGRKIHILKLEVGNGRSFPGDSSVVGGAKLPHERIEGRTIKSKMVNRQNEVM